jgi:hypothetical protein
VKEKKIYHVKCYDRKIITEFLENNYPDNPYPKDIFTWDNPLPKRDEILSTKGQFNKFLHKLWERPKELILKELEEEDE